LKNYTDFHSIAGIDYGSKLAGTTVIVWHSPQGIEILQSRKNEDADEMIANFIKTNTAISNIFIDAPLSLPTIYSNIETLENPDFFYRQCDVEVGAMSPMFLGGLTARAMRLKFQFAKRVHFFETYPGFYARMLGLSNFGYKKELANIEICTHIVRNDVDVLMPQTQNWHQFDAAIAFIAAKRWLENKSIIFGNKQEAMIYI
jgi:predicted nuclease with RNAse H fold